MSTGDYEPERGDELLLQHHPSGMDVIGYEVLAWNGKKLVRKRLFEEGPFPPHGMQLWSAVRRARGSRSLTIASQTSLYTAEKTWERAEILRWDGPKPAARFILPGEPLVGGHFRGANRWGVVVQHPTRGPMLLEAR
jgi:hypothetical protein